MVSWVGVMTTGLRETLGPFIGADTTFPSWYKRKEWSGTDKSSTGGLQVPHPYTCTVFEEDAGAVRYDCYNYLVYTHRYMCGVPPDLCSVSWDSNQENALLGKLAEKIKGHDFNAGLFFGTSHLTLRLIANNANKLYRGLRALKRGRSPRVILRELGYSKSKSRAAGKTTVGFLRKDLSSRWLELSYGWLPLVKDVYEAGKALASESLTRQFRFTVRRSVREVLQGSSAIQNYSHTRVVRKQLIYNLTASSIAGRLGLTDPAEILWELTPWSFVVDWFLPIGTYLGNRAFFSSVQGSWVATLTTIDHKTSASTGCIRSQKPYKSRDLTMTRTCGNGPLEVPLPRFKSPISQDWRRAANAIALLNKVR